MRPVRPTAVHKTDRLAELVCSNSFRGDKLDNAVGLLKEEMRRLGSLVMRAADAARVPAGAALAVDRERFSATVTDAIASHPLHHASCARRSPAIPVGARRPGDHRDRPLTSDALSADIAALVGSEHLYFYDAISPIVLAEIDRHVEGVPRVALGPEPAADRRRRPRAPDRQTRRSVEPGVRRGRRRRRLPELPVHARRVRAVLRGADVAPRRRRCTSSTRRSSSKAACRSR